MLVTQAQSARAVGGASVALGTAVAISPAKIGKLLGADIKSGQERFLARQIGLDLTALGAVLLTAAEAQRRGGLVNVAASATALAGVTIAALAKKDIPRRYAVPMLAVTALLGTVAVLPLVGD